ncbi:MAG TPA: SAM-dependent methyltransferase [bacterium]|nr:SAM-dependent methyltransferase [bacterium]
MKKKFILDACCGGRMFWFEKKNPNVLFCDKRWGPKGFMKTRPNFEVRPNTILDFRNMPFSDRSFKMVVFDPPHTIRNREQGGVIAERYGRLTIATWEADLGAGFAECWRVLENYGTIIFKWAESDKKISQIKHLFPSKPLFGSRGGAKGGTIWLCFMKIPAEVRGK